MAVGLSFDDRGGRTRVDCDTFDAVDCDADVWSWDATIVGTKSQESRLKFSSLLILRTQHGKEEPSVFCYKRDPKIQQHSPTSLPLRLGYLESLVFSRWPTEDAGYGFTSCPL